MADNERKYVFSLDCTEEELDEKIRQSQKILDDALSGEGEYFDREHEIEYRTEEIRLLYELKSVRFNK